MNANQFTKTLFLALLVLLFRFNTDSQIPSPSATPTPLPSAAPPRASGNLFRDVLRDQKVIWTSPFRLGAQDLKWAAPWTAVTAAMIATDRQTSQRIGSRGSLPGISRDVSFAGSNYATAAIATGMYVIGRKSHNSHLQETGKLAGEALIDTYLVTQASKFVFGRLRPDEDGGRGRFFQGGRSFFSGHSAQAWAIASVVSCEYSDRRLVKYGSMAGATLVSLSRLSGRRHFLSDVFVGASVGYLVGRYVCREHGTQRTPASGASPETFSWKPSLSPWIDNSTGFFGARLTWHP